MQITCKAKYKIIRFLFSFGSLFLFIQIFSQAKIDVNKRKLFYQQYDDKSYNPDKLLARAKNMLKYAQNDYEKALAYSNLGDCLYGQGNYLESVKILQKADSLIKKTDSIQNRITILYSLINSYRRAELIVESEETWELVKGLDKESSPFIKTANLLYTQAKIFDIDGNFCKAADTREKYIQHIRKIPNTEYKNMFDFAMLVQLCYEQIRCGRIDEAKETLEKTEIALKKIKNKSPINLYEFYLLDKALINVKDNNLSEARKNFDLAYSQPNIDRIVIKEILMNRLQANIDTPTEQLKFSKIISDITNSQITVTKNLTIEETTKDKNSIKEKKENIKLNLIIFIFIIIVLIICVIFIFRAKNKNIKSRYQKIIKDLENQHSEPTIFSESQTSTSDFSKEKILISEETEREILKKLDAFEKKRLYTTKGISAAQMSVMLKTNTKYLNYIIKKYRNSDFYNYINTQRINYIVKELHDNPHLLQYKISVLADMCGYNSHSQFGSIFKSIKNISPSQYISFLTEEQKNKS
ncbi:AraC-type DNA-binding protein [Chryseobacterium ureilyticum]|uniref:AraC-type DNA-binding protein n=1 Tax=Chryseobacterium ureilyticum TaxID=373668 RepID=A0A1N7LA16_9FLAO|nr:helix-turn-helix domain-containing protein [Chryseobacterium ureilyticum]SIS70678.1 AraC-type DNA-binding protein [Chryseobacterium ureilyticum]